MILTRKTKAWWSKGVLKPSELKELAWIGENVSFVWFSTSHFLVWKISKTSEIIAEEETVNRE